jgi:DNA invertase Pin-like site-specific DNA recombinase
MGARPDHPSPVTDRELADRLAQVRRRLERLAERVARTGVLVPTRRVGRVSFMGRHLFEIRGRYVAKVTDDVAERIFEAHQRGMSLAEAARHAGVSRDTVRRWWSRAGKEPHSRPCNETTPAVVASILESYRRHRGDARTAGEAHGVSASTVYRYWKRAGLTRSRPAAPLDEKALADLRAAHGTHGGNAASAARALGLSPSTVRKYWKKAGLAPRKPGRPPRA